MKELLISLAEYNRGANATVVGIVRELEKAMLTESSALLVSKALKAFRTKSLLRCTWGLDAG